MLNRNRIIDVWLQMPKLVIECQGCETSLTIIYSYEESAPDKQVEYKAHLANLMFAHMKTHPKDPVNSKHPHKYPGVDLKKVNATINVNDPVAYEKVRDSWVKVLKQ